MKKSRIGNSELFASTIGLGCMSLQPKKQLSETIIHQAIEKGINYFDTADLYDFGQNEELLGRALKGKRQDVIVATKVGNQWKKGKEGWNWNPRKTYIKEAVKHSLKRLNTDYIDLYQLHGGTIDDPIEETIEAFEELINEGWIRYYGISSIRPKVIKQYVEKSNIISVMMQYSLLDRRAEEAIIEHLNQNNISVIPRGPLAKGLLTENFLNKIKSEGYLDYNEHELKNTLIKLQQWAKNHDYKLHELALQYCLSTPNTATVIPGASTIEQLKANVTTSQKLALTKDMVYELKSMLKESKYHSHR
ncbi:oxidoreductase [Anaerobacillus alkalilacustris]|uniref:Oxidoreductase n=1 Tax=Anaerobacillus alkalilacustris TaxID=393763 RepID=A0A1S2LES5_9BACI|nr:aldo/keto reductase [Anaerobacillus alkalilacustris]OIJ10740.1 oxidoreductase [Anaerobacillus alkalilacustris]